MAADLILTGAVVRTVNRAQPTAEAIAFEAGRVLAVGSGEEVLAHRGEATRVRDLEGRAVYPGFVDVHNHHALAGATELFELDFSPAAPLEEILALVRARAAASADDRWITGGAWGSTLLDALNTSSTLARLDEAAGGHPVMLYDDSRHNRWANTQAMRLAGISRHAAPDEGVTLRDADGEPTGVLLEAAGLLVAHAHARTAALTAEQHRAASQRGIARLNAYGVTAFQDAGASIDIMRALACLDRADELDAWVVSSMLVNDEIFGFELIGAPLLDRGEEFRTAHHRPDFVKVFLDGVPPARTSLFLDPYLPDEAHGAHFHGTTTMDFNQLYDALRMAAERGLGAKIHVTGDGSARLLLDMIERLRDENFTDTRFQLAHGQFLADDDLARLVRLDVVADICPFLWFPGVIPQALADVLGPERASHAQPNRAILDAGGLIAGGSDWPAGASLNPFEGMQGLITRADPFGRAPGTMWPEQALTAEEAHEVYTINAATAMGLGDITGSLEPGKSADFAVLDRDVIAGPAEAIVDARVLETWVRGRRVYVAE